MKAIGPSFPFEIRAAGVGGLPFTWSADGTFEYAARMTPAQIAAVQAVYVAHDPAAVAPPLPDVALKTAVAAALRTPTVQPDDLKAVLTAWSAVLGN